MKRYLDLAMIVVISLLILFCSLVTWPSIEGKIVTKMRGVTEEIVHHREPVFEVCSVGLPGAN